mmetsp:Transcript_20881/g.2797  ORF Transcript_20881/g.2797 Transcript_20881/m.2797 type:complete len:93 (+) Transcript_20881:244-522(+)|eukprot:CAMPEP_0204821018 /NCGR_PEP_ID=MMETSP1018-20131115/1464_1 /ASSEMBLY_ACC=CAM_ASM_000518 /TAXON_ID=46462 /ORGANISM="Anophryoides haemophila, Strain AH6" /LENGTH=92 /DNA_ID=CAMNT_0051918673 /DNA_START=505 /DNA_END=783 /DNA_ORIENTATION=-
MTLAVELGPKNIRVNGIAPGAIDGTEGLKRLSSSGDRSIVDLIPAQRLGKKSDIASAVLFLVSDAASYITGHTMVVDGAAKYTFPNFPLASE